ncbi:MAG: hypothetical protein V7707_02525 [Motiliproteus sp.]
MSKWNEQLSSHAIQTTITNLTESLKNDSLISDDITVIDLIDKINQGVSYSKICIANAIPSLINIGHLNNANAQLASALSEISNFITNKNITHLNNASNNIDAVMPQLNALPIPSSIISEETHVEAVESFRAQIEKSLLSLKSLNSELVETITTISDKSAQQSHKISSISDAIDQHQESIEESLENFNLRFDTLENESSAKIDIIAANADDKCNNIETNYQTSLESKKAEIEDAFTDILDKNETEHAKQSEKLSSSANKIIQALEKNKLTASNLVQIIGNIGITGNYQKIANQEKEAADKWRNIALGLMIGMVVVIAFTIAISASNGFDWKLALFRIGAALILAIPATYAARESTKHRALENHNRRAELELASLDPFLEKLPEEVRHKVKEGLTDKFFGLTSPELNNEDPATTTALIDLLKTAISKK